MTPSLFHRSFLSWRQLIAITAHRVSRRIANGLIGVLAFAAIAVCPAPASASGMSSILEHPSLETTLMTFEIAGVHYRIPRNYIVSMDNWAGGHQDGMVGLKIAFPSFQGITKDNQKCFAAPAGYMQNGCMPIRVLIAGGHGNSTAEGFRYDKHNFISQNPKKGPYGFELYEMGPEDARQEFYRKAVSGHTIQFDCILYRPSNHPNKRGGCRTNARLNADASIWYSFYLDDLASAEKLDEGLRATVSSFIVSGDEK